MSFNCCPNNEKYISNFCLSSSSLTLPPTCIRRPGRYVKSVEIFVKGHILCVSIITRSLELLKFPNPAPLSLSLRLSLISCPPFLSFAPFSRSPSLSPNLSLSLSTPPISFASLSHFSLPVSTSLSPRLSLSLSLSHCHCLSLSRLLRCLNLQSS